jgi:hypothetical protein
MKEEFNYPPKEDCNFCNGTGKRRNECICICLFVNHDHSNGVGIALSEFATREKNKIRAGDNSLAEETHQALLKVLRIK